MPKKKIDWSLSVQLIASDGSEIVQKLEARKAWDVFEFYVTSLLRGRHYLREVNILDARGRIYKSFKQHY